MPRLTPFYGLALALALAPAHAAACWDGFAAQHGRAVVTGGDAQWSVNRARHLAEWLPRIDALLGFADADIDVAFGVVSGLSADGPSFEARFADGKMDRLFRVLAQELGVPQTQRRAALAHRGRAWTVQIAALRDPAAAQRAIQRVDAFEEHAAHGFYEAGGFPADNAFAHLVQAHDQQGHSVYRVIVGAFLDRDEASGVADSLRAHSPFEAFVRPL